MKRIPILVFSALVLPAAAQEAQDGRPNLLVLVGDDHAASALGCAGHSFVQTPVLDALAADGVRFTHAFATTALCSPSRASLLTGRWARQHEIVDNDLGFPVDTPTYLSILGEHGYETGFVGKWHMGAANWSRPALDFCATFEGQGEYRDCEFKVGDRTGRESGFVDDVIAAFAVDFLQRERDRPFVLTVAFKQSHGPRQPKEHLKELYVDAEMDWPTNVGALPPFPTDQEYRDLVRARDAKPHKMRIKEHWDFNRSRRALAAGQAEFLEPGRLDYFRLVTGLDENVGEVLAALDAFGLAENTIVVYLSDNGLLNGEHSLNGKGAAYEESIRIPWIVRHPGLGDPGRTIDELVLNVDLAPTLLEWAGVPVPADVSGRSLAGLLAGADVEWRRGFVYEYWREGRYANTPSHVAWRERDWKLIEYPDYPSWRALYHLVEDPGETRNLARDEDQIDRLLELRERLHEAELELGPRAAR